MKEEIRRVDGVPVYLAEEGTGPPVLFLHGWGATAKFWRRSFAALAGRFRCLAADWPGFGRSGKPDAVYQTDWLAATPSFDFDTLHLDFPTRRILEAVAPHIKTQLQVPDPLAGPSLAFFDSDHIIFRCLFTA